MKSDISRRRALATIGAGGAATVARTAALAAAPDHSDGKLLSHVARFHRVYQD